MDTTQVISRRIKITIDAAQTRLLAITEEQATAKPFQEKWSLKEILGHLVDSASNNHQRFVRMQEVADMGKFVYEQTHWVNSQHYNAKPWTDLVNLWYFYNKHLAFVVEHMDPKSLSNICHTDDDKPKTLEFIASDYVRHLEHHLGQIFSSDSPKERKRWE